LLPVFFIFGGLVFNFLLSGHFSGSKEIFGGPELANASESFSSEEAVLNANFSPGEFGVAENDEDFSGFLVLDEDSLVNLANPLAGTLTNRESLMIYKVQSGDSLSKIAANFDISLNTILWANPNLKSQVLKPGQELIILPISGVLHQVQEGETSESIAALYSVDISLIQKFNPNSLSSTLIIPGAKPKRNLTQVSVLGLSNFNDYFAIPSRGWNWGRLHSYNAVDIANACGTPIYAAAEGLVSQVDYGWNGGYGNYLIIEHPFGENIWTRYAHLLKSAVSIGDYVLQGDLIGYIGNTGNTHGPTGCHLHFEVNGAKNPFAK
jgi:murein DD-endopeptidase MepM/ murein hydrolase activator NlpD